jgi:hypothetical protein
MAAGTDSAIFIEDNFFITDENFTGSSHNECIGSLNGGKLVIRYNDFNGWNSALGEDYGYVPIMTHGSHGWAGSDCYWQADHSDERANRRGQSVVEIYGNTAKAKRMNTFINVRGSANLIYDNQVTEVSTYNPVISMEEEEYWSSAWTVHRTAWPAEDQVHNTFIWNNTYRGHDFNDGVYGKIYVASNCSEYIRINRDYFLHEPQSTGGKEYFTGLNGASDTYPTDGNTFATYGTMVFTPDGANEYYGYVPYVYPHPLRGVKKTVRAFMRIRK